MIRRTFLAMLAAISPGFAGTESGKEMKPDVLYIEDEDEEMLEEFAVGKATWNLRQHPDGTWEFTIAVKTNKVLKQSQQRAEVFNSLPNFESTTILDPKEVKIAKGQIMVQNEPYDRKRDINLSWFYYSGGGGLEKLRIEILDQSEEWLDVKLTGVYDGLDSKVALRTKFKKDPNLKREVE